MTVRLPPPSAISAASISGIEGDLGDGAQIELDVRDGSAIAVASHLDVMRPGVERQRRGQRRASLLLSVDPDLRGRQGAVDGQVAERRLTGDQLEADLLRLSAGDVDRLARRRIAGGDHPDDVVPGGDAQRPALGRAPGLDVVDFDRRRHVGADLQEGDEGPLLGPDLLRLFPLLGAELGGALEQGVEGVDGVDGPLQLGVHEADVEQRRRVAGDLVRPLELHQRTRVFPPG